MQHCRRLSFPLKCNCATSTLTVATLQGKGATESLSGCTNPVCPRGRSHLHLRANRQFQRCRPRRTGAGAAGTWRRASPDDDRAPRSGHPASVPLPTKPALLPPAAGLSPRSVRSEEEEPPRSNRACGPVIQGPGFLLPRRTASGRMLLFLRSSAGVGNFVRRESSAASHVLRLPTRPTNGPSLFI
jgi:hypothetical protein